MLPGPRAASDLSPRLRELADAVDRGEIVELVLGCVRGGEYELMFSAPLTGGLILASLLHRRAVDKFITD